MFGADEDIEVNAVSFALYNLRPESIIKLKSRIWNELQVFIADYIWQKDCLSVNCSTEVSPPWTVSQTDGDFLWGHVRYGDSVDDEWFIVSLFWKLTEIIPSVVVQIWDDDGEFLLIETAYVLPKWIKPETSTNRVWIKEGALHVIPRKFPENGNEERLTVQQSLKVLSSDVKTRAKENAQQLIKDRIRMFPNQRVASQHWAKCKLPLKAAHLLSQHPKIISAVIENFVHQERFDNHSFSLLQCFEMNEMVMSMVKFHRTSYAQLHQMEFALPENSALRDILDVNAKADYIGLKLVFALNAFFQKDWTSLNNLKTSSFFPSETWNALQRTLEEEITVDEYRKNKPSFEEDDESWLTNGEQDLDAELLKRELEQQKKNIHDSNATEFADKFSDFVNTVSSHEGVEIRQSVGFTANRFMSELKRVLGSDFEQEFKKLGISSSESDLSDDDLSEGDDPLMETDSDDDSKFDEAYNEALQSELQETQMRESFVQKEESSLPEVDIDANLVQNLAKSLDEQHGASGPAGNISSLLNLTIPHRSK